MKPAPPVTRTFVSDGCCGRSPLDDEVVVRGDRPGPLVAQRLDAAVEQPRDAVQQRDDAPADGPQRRPPQDVFEVDRVQHRERGGRARAGGHRNRTPVAVLPEQPLEPGARPAPQVDRVRVVDHRAVRGEQHAATRARVTRASSRTPWAGSSTCSSTCAQSTTSNDASVRGDRLDRPVERRPRVVTRVHPDDLRGVRLNSVRYGISPQPTSSIRYGPRSAARALGLGGEPARERRPHGVRRHRERRIEARRHSRTVTSPIAIHVIASSGRPGTSPIPAHTPARRPRPSRGRRARPATPRRFRDPGRDARPPRGRAGRRSPRSRGRPRPAGRAAGSPHGCSGDGNAWSGSSGKRSRASARNGSYAHSSLDACQPTPVIGRSSQIRPPMYASSVRCA